MAALTSGRPRLETALLLLLSGAMLIASVVFLLHAPNDPDFFWHLKSGEWIWQHKALPASDPFNYMNETVAGGYQRFTLTAYWLAQILYHLVHTSLGMAGIVALKFLSFFLLLAALLSLRRGDPVIHASLVLSALPLFGLVYTYERPHVFSFLFFALLLLLLERERHSPAVPPLWQSCLAAALLLVVWGNMHGGHLLGQFALLIFMALEAAKFAHPSLRPLSKERYRRLLIVGCAGLVGSLANPNPLRALRLAFGVIPTWMQNTEYNSTLIFFKGQPLVAIFWGALALTALSLLATIRRPDITWIIFLAGLGFKGFMHIRYVPFFMIAALPLIGATLTSARHARWLRPLVVAGSLLLVAFPMWDFFPTRESALRALRVNEQQYPVGAADFVLANRPSGNLYNTYLWGGYLIWRLGPERKVFVDGRGLSPRPVFESFTISIAFTNPNDPPPLWKRLLRQYGIGYLIIPRVDGNAGVKFDEVGRLRAALLEAPEWVPVFADAISLVFVQNAPEHREIIRKYAIPRDSLLPEHR